MRHPHSACLLIVLLLLSLIRPQHALADDPYPRLYLSPYLANLHSHTIYSDDAQLLILNNTPDFAFQNAYGNGTQILAITDHAELLTPHAYPGDLPSRDFNFYYNGHISEDEWGATNGFALAASQGGFLGLRGFEWSADGGQQNEGDFEDYVIESSTENIGHINVIGSQDYVAHHYVRNDVQGSSAWQKKTLREFFDWVENQVSISPEMFCQFNHPNGYSSLPFTEITDYGQGNTVIGLLTAPPSRYPKIAAPYGPFALIELSSERFDIDHHIAPEEEYRDTSNVHLWQQALQAGWRLAPALNEDNHVGGYGSKDDKTVIWSKLVSRSYVLDAVKKRHVYATEVRTLNLKFWAEEGGRTAIMGDTTRKAASLTLRARLSIGNNTTFPRVEVIEIRRREPLPGAGRRGTPMVYGSNSEYQLEVTPNPDTVCYYLRVEIVQGEDEDEENPNNMKMAYSAPIWITSYQLQPENKAAPRGEPVQISAKLSNRLNSKVLEGRSVRFRIGSTVIGQDTTDASGTATIVYALPSQMSLGNHEITAEYTTDEYITDEQINENYLVITAAATLTVLENSGTSITVANRVADIGETITLQATLKRNSDDWIVRGRRLIFRVDNTLIGNADTNENGVAEINYTVPENVGNGLHSINVAFAGDPRYTASSGSGTLKIGNVVYVRPDGFDESDGATWQTAKRTVQAGVNAAAGLAQVWIAEGTYTEQVNLGDGAALYGGFSGNESTLSQRNWQNHPTTIAAPDNQNGLIRATTTPQATIRLDGLTLRNTRGAAAELNNCSPVVVNCTTTEYGAGIYLNDCFVATIRHNTFQNSGVNGSVRNGMSVVADNRFNNGSLSFSGDFSSPPDVTLSNNTLSNGGSLNLGGRLGSITATNNHGVGSRAFIGISGNLARNSTLTVQDNCSFASLYGLTVESGATLTLAGGVVFHNGTHPWQLDSMTRWNINGDLRSTGTPDNPAILTSIGDNTPYGGTNETPSLFWRGLLYANGNHARLSGLTLKHAVIALQVDTAFLTDCTFLLNNIGVESRNGGGIYRFCTFQQNGMAVQNNGTPTVDARYCDWGHPSGPYNALSNPNGQGNPISDRVLYFPMPSRGRAGQLSGRITLQGVSSPSRVLAFTFRSNRGNFTRNVQLDNIGQFRITNLPFERYAVAIKAPRRLQEVTNVIIGDRTADMNVLLLAGDANADNAVDIFDLMLLIQHYNQRQGTSNYLEAVDFNEDSSNDISDLILLIQNYNRKGNP